ncbi:MAG: VCBS repeat-containing protein [Polyangiales bacterium]
MPSTKQNFTRAFAALAQLVLLAGLVALALPSAQAEAQAQTPAPWSAALGWCNHAGAQLFIGDFNGDGRDDMLCHDGQGRKWVALATWQGRFTGTSWQANLGWCNHAGARLFIGDFNGDGRDDMLCHDGQGRKWVALANYGGQFSGTSWSANLGWCNHAGSQLFVGDFNGDGRDDMLCHDNQGRKWVSLATSSGSFTGTSWSASLGWCNHTGSQLFIGDYNGDRRDDMLCHDNLGRKWVALATPSGSFTGTSWSANLGYCHHAGARLFIGGFNQDRRDDIMCHDNAGAKWIRYATPAGSF